MASHLRTSICKMSLQPTLCSHYEGQLSQTSIVCAQLTFMRIEVFRDIYEIIKSTYTVFKFATFFTIIPLTAFFHPCQEG